MARTNFYALYRLLDKQEQEIFSEALALEAAGLSQANAFGPIFAKGFRHEGKTERGPTRAAWIDSIIYGSYGMFGSRKPVDLMSLGSGSTASQNSTSLGSMLPDRSVDSKFDLAVLELRRLPKKVHRLEWSPMALKIFDLIVGLNKSGGSKSEIS